MRHLLKDPELWRTGAFVGGEWIYATPHGTYALSNPANNEVLVDLPRFQEAETANAIDTAHQAFLRWRKTTAKARSEILHHWYELMLQHRDDLARAWQRAALWGQASAPDAAQRSTADSAVAVAAIDQWQIFYHRGETWGNPLSSVGNESAGTPPTTTQVSLPNGVRLVLTLSTGQAMQGTLTRDWVRPTLEAGS